MKELVFTILDLQLDDSCLFYFYIPSIDSVWPAYNKMFLCIMYLCVFVMAVCPMLMCLGILDLNTNHSITFYPLCYKETYDLCNIHFSYHGLYSQLHHGHFSQYCFLFIKFHFTQLSKKNFLYQNKKKIVKKGEKFYSIIWMALVGVIRYYMTSGQG